MKLDAALAPQHAAEVMRTTARFHCDRASRQIRCEAQDAVAGHATPPDDAPGLIQTCGAAAVLPRSIRSTAISIGPLLS
jgi:hypothetical protein